MQGDKIDSSIANTIALHSTQQRLDCPQILASKFPEDRHKIANAETQAWDP
jgi:hypothetical protein